jgi:Cys-rich repeat protein
MIEEALLKSNYIGKDGFYWWIGQVANQNSWKSKSQFSEEKGSDGQVWASRCKVRIVGHHTFDGNVLPDDDLPWAQIMMDPAFGSGQGGMGATINLKGGETCFGFFIDGDDAQQPVVMGLLHRSDGVKNLISEEAIAKEKSSQFKPFTGHPGNNIPATQRSARKDKEINPENPQTETSPLSAKDKVDIAFNPTVGFYTGTSRVFPQYGDRLQFDASSIWQVAKKADISITIPSGCQNGLIGDITQGLQDFMAITNGLDRYLNVYVDTVLNEIVDIRNQIRKTARSILGIVKLIINNLRNTIMKCITWAFRKLVGLVIPQPQQKIVLEAMKKILDIIFCILEKLPSSLLDFITNALQDLVDRTLNVPPCAAEQWTAGILAQLMNAIEDALSGIMSGISWLTGGLGTISGILNQASSLASQIFSFLECTGLACKQPHTWAAKFGPSEKEADDWKKMVSNVNVFKIAANAGSSIEDALRDTPLYSATDTFGTGFGGLIDSALRNVSCASKVINPTNQDDLMRMPIGSRWKTCIPPQVYITGDGVGAKAIPIVGDGGSIFSIQVIRGGCLYTNATVSIVDKSGYGTGASAKAIVSENGSIENIIVLTPGTGFCKGNTTESPCVSDANCPPGEICVNGKCVPEKPCSPNDCPQGYVYQDGKCVPQPCSIDNDCPTGFICENGKCVPKPCSIDNDCPTGFICENGKCVPERTCNVDSDCPTGFICENGKCVPKPCSIDNDCPPGYVCRNGKCVPDNKFPGLTTSITGCVKDVIVQAPGYGYLFSDTATDGKNIYNLTVSNSGAIIKVSLIQKDAAVCGFKEIPTISINTNTGVAAELIPIMEYTPSYSSVTSSTSITTSISGIGVTSVIDCV